MLHSWGFCWKHSKPRYFFLSGWRFLVQKALEHFKDVTFFTFKWMKAFNLVCSDKYTSSSTFNAKQKQINLLSKQNKQFKHDSIYDLLNKSFCCFLVGFICIYLFFSQKADDRAIYYMTQSSIHLSYYRLKISRPDAATDYKQKSTKGTLVCSHLLFGCIVYQAVWDESNFYTYNQVSISLMQLWI